MSDWWIFVDDQEKGPFSTERLIDFFRSRDTTGVYVWREGFQEWQLARDVPELQSRSRPAPPLTIIPDARDVPEAPRSSRKARWSRNGCLIGLGLGLLRVVSETSGSSDVAENVGYVAGSAIAAAALGFVIGALADRRREPKDIATEEIEATPEVKGNWIARHWRGQLPLWVSYWVIGFVVNLALAIIPPIILAVFKSESGYYPPGIFATISLIWLSVVVVGAWQFVGVWRSAARYTATRTREGRTAFWGGLAQAVVVLGTLGTAATVLKQGGPQLVEAFNIAFQGDPSIPDYSIRVMRDGTEAEIVGGFKYGLTDDFAKILNASRQIKVVHLDSVGGRVGEGEKLFELIRGRGLSTYVSSKCLSACTLAFVAGRERYMASHAQLGFHKGAFPGANEGVRDEVQHSVFRRAGIQPKFVETALSTPHSGMWRPSIEILKGAGVITAVAEAQQFAFSGLGADLSRESMASAIAGASPVFQSIKERFPKRFDIFVDNYFESITKGKTEAETVEKVRGQLLPFILSLVPQADDDVLVEYNRLMVDQLAVLGAKSPALCYQYASGTDYPGIFKEFSTAIQQRERDLQSRVVRTAQPRATLREEDVERILDRVRERLAASKTNLEILDVEKLDRQRYGEYCDVMIKFFREIGRLPQQESATVMRHVLASK